MIDKQVFILERSHFQHLLDVLHSYGYTVIGPTLADGAVVYNEISSETELPVGWTDEQEAGFYRLSKRTDDALFGYTVSPQSWKRFLHPPQVSLVKAARTNGSFSAQASDEDVPRFAFIGVRACELHAIAIQDRVFLQGAYVDPIYQQRREGVFIVAVNCGQAAKTCFCTSLGTGPAHDAGFDLLLTEVIEAESHYFIVEAGTERGIEVLNQLPCREAAPDEIARAEQVVTDTAAQIERHIDTTNLKQTLYASHDSPHWQTVAQRCLACGNCTMVCPTCFCTTVEDVTDLSGDQAERRRVWDSCFTMDFSYIHGGSVRYSPEARYRQWLTHKMASWIDQFGTMGCVGCGRCIAWCPVGIDITAEAKALQEKQKEG